MVKLIIQFLILVASFVGMWLGLSQVDWMKILHVRETSESIEEKLGELYWDIFKNIEEEITSDKIISPVDSLVTRICDRNDISRKKIKLHIVDKDEINAFALPDYHLVVFSGLISDSENEAELSGVLAHEIAHMEKGHIMKKLVREIGLSVLLSMTTGNGNPEMIQQAMKVLTSSAYDRALEQEADLTGVDYLLNAGIDPNGFAEFMFRMSSREANLPDQLFWISSHPGSEERTKSILEYIGDKKIDKVIVLDSAQWADLKVEIRNN